MPYASCQSHTTSATPATNTSKQDLWDIQAHGAQNTLEEHGTLMDYALHMHGKNSPPGAKAAVQEALDDADTLVAKIHKGLIELGETHQHRYEYMDSLIDLLRGIHARARRINCHQQTPTNTPASSQGTIPVCIVAGPEFSTTIQPTTLSPTPSSAPFALAHSFCLATHWKECTLKECEKHKYFRLLSSGFSNQGPFTIH